MNVFVFLELKVLNYFFLMQITNHTYNYYANDGKLAPVVPDKMYAH